MAEQLEIFEGEPADTRAAIMHATYEALSKHGYAELTIQRIGDEFEKSKSLLYHHYESKDELLVDFLDFMLKQMEADMPLEQQPDAYRRLLFTFDYVFEELLSPERETFMRALTELRAQAATNDTFREQINENEQFLKARYEDIIQQGIEEGIFRDVDTERTAEMLLSVMDGLGVRYTTCDEVDPENVRKELEAYVRHRLLDADIEA